MNTITIAGAPGSGKAAMADKLFAQRVAQGEHVLIEQDGAVRRSSNPALSDRLAATKIRTKTTGGPLTVS